MHIHQLQQQTASKYVHIIILSQLYSYNQHADLPAATHCPYKPTQRVCLCPKGFQCTAPHAGCL